VFARLFCITAESFQRVNLAIRYLIRDTSPAGAVGIQAEEVALDADHEQLGHIRFAEVAMSRADTVNQAGGFNS